MSDDTDAPRDDGDRRAGDDKLYAERDIEALSAHYMRHLSAMTREALHGKSDIAAELAWRDAEIERLERTDSCLESAANALPAALAERDRLAAEVVTLKRERDEAVKLLDDAQGLLCLCDTPRGNEDEMDEVVGSIADFLAARCDCPPGTGVGCPRGEGGQTEEPR